MLSRSAQTLLLFVVGMREVSAGAPCTTHAPILVPTATAAPKPAGEPCTTHAPARTTTPCLTTTILRTTTPCLTTTVVRTTTPIRTTTVVRTTTPCPTTTPSSCGNYACPQNMVQRPHPHALMCPAGGCFAEHCCLTTTTQLNCASFTCPGTGTLRPHAENYLCGHWGCTHETCCLCATTTPKIEPPRPTCATYNVCPAPMTYKPNPSTRVCPGHCDTEYCCDVPVIVTTTPATCGSQGTLFCGEMTARSGMILCPPSGCTKDFCCIPPTTPAPAAQAPPVTCATYNCTGGWTRKVDAQLYLCGSTPCVNGHCCNPPVTTITTTQLLTCDTFACTGTPKKMLAKLIMCPAGGCSPALCCKEAPPKTCNATTLCTGSSVARPMLEQIVCPDAGCTMDLCCSHTTCADYVSNATATTGAKCPGAMTQKPHLDILVCPAAGCDSNTCCDQPTCLNYACPTSPAVRLPRPRPQAITCIDSKGCQPSECCFMPTCKDHACPTKMTLKLGASQIQCPAGGCGQTECCDNPTCATFQCLAPRTNHVRPHAITCAVTGCEASDCCNNPTCASLTCPPKRDPLPNPQNIVCKNATACTKDECCEGETCASFQCHAPSTLRPSPHSVACPKGDFTSGGLHKDYLCDAPLCCLQPTTTPSFCGGFSCPPFHAPKPGALGRMCPSTGCSSSFCCIGVTTTPLATTTPCPTTTPLSCAHYSCTLPNVRVPAAGATMCPAGGCNEKTCCVCPTTTPTLTCGMFACPAHSIARPQSAAIKCPNNVCTPKQCCLQTCAGFACPEKETLNSEPLKRMCPAVGCTAKQCCSIPNPCSTVPTPPPAKLYSREEAGVVQQAVATAMKEPAKSSNSWALPIIGSFAMFAFAAGLYHRSRRSMRPTREVHTIDPFADDAATLLDYGSDQNLE